MYTVRVSSPNSHLIERGRTSRPGDDTFQPGRVRRQDVPQSSVTARVRRSEHPTDQTGELPALPAGHRAPSNSGISMWPQGSREGGRPVTAHARTPSTSP